MRSSQSARSWIPALKSLSIRSARIRSSSSGSLGVSSRCSAISSVISGATTGTFAMCPGSSWFGVSSIIEGGGSPVQLDFGDVRHRDLGGEFAADELDPPQLRVLVLGDGLVQHLPGDGLRMLAGVLGQEGVDVVGRALAEDHRVHQPDLDHGCFKDCFSNRLLSCSNSSNWWEYFSSLFASSSVRQIYPGAQREKLITGRTGIGSPGS